MKISNYSAGCTAVYFPNWIRLGVGADSQVGIYTVDQVINIGCEGGTYVSIILGHSMYRYIFGMDATYLL